MYLRTFLAKTTATTLLLAGVAIGTSPSTGMAAPQSQVFEAINSQDYFTVPSGVTRLSIDLVAASDSWGQGLGARVIADIAVTPGETLEISVGSRGDYVTGRGGWPDGGDGGGQVGNSNASGGGGSTSIRNQSNGGIIAIAGAGGGGSNFSLAGQGGYPIGGDGHYGWVGRDDMNGKGATQSAGGVGGCSFDRSCPSYTNGGFGFGGSSAVGGGGGGGYYGGGAGGGGVDGNDVYSPSGGGGSSWIDTNRVFSGTSVTHQPGYFPSNLNEWRNNNGWATLTWTPDATTTTIATTTTSTATTTSTSSTSSTSTTITTSTSITTTTTPPATTFAPTWTSQPETERELPVVGRAPFPVSGIGSVAIVNEGGYVINSRNVFTPRWRTRVYIGTFKFTLRATYIVKKKKQTYTCTFPKFGTETKVLSSRNWRWYTPPKGCTLPKDLVTQLSQGKTTLQFTGSFSRKWATSGKTTRPDGTKISTLKISLVIAGSESVALN